MAEHDPLSFANSLSAKLATRSRHVCALLGAGAARACGLPDVAGLEKNVAAKLAHHQATAFKGVLHDRNLEQGLSRLRRIHTLVEGSDQEVDGITSDAAQELDHAICRAIVTELDLANADLEPMVRFAAWVARADYHLPLEIFTVNYDLLIETALEKLRVPYSTASSGHSGLRSVLTSSRPRQLMLSRGCPRSWPGSGSCTAP